MSSFNDPNAVARYAEGPRRMVPGLDDLHKMTRLLLAEAAGPAAHILVLGAGGGMELKAFAEAEPGWRFTGIDPSAPMLDLARQTLGPHAARTTLHEGTIDTAPPGPFDGATCLLTLHFLPREPRLETLRQLHNRLKPGARLVTAYHAFAPAENLLWLTRFAAFARSNGTEMAPTSLSDMATRLPALSPAEDESLLHTAGFTDVQLFYAAFSFRGWVATKP